MTDRFNFTWGLDDLGELGFVPLYQFMLRSYAKLGLTRNEMLCIIHLASYHYNSPGGKSKPGLAQIAREMGYSHKQRVSELITGLEEKKMLLVFRRLGDTSIYNAAPFAHAAFALWVEEKQGVTQKRNTGVTPGSNRGLRSSVTKEEEENKKVEEEVAPEAPAGEELSWTVESIYYKDPRLNVLGKRRSGPWSIECFDCGTPVKFVSMETEEECLSCGQHYKVVLQRKPTQVSFHLALDKYYRLTRAKGIRYGSLEPETESEIVETVGHHEDPVTFWGRVIHNWLMLGWNPLNVPQMLAWFKAGQIPQRGVRLDDGRGSPESRNGPDRPEEVDGPAEEETAGDPVDTITDFVDSISKS